MLIKPLSLLDIPAIVAIEQAVQVSPWSSKMFEESLKHHARGWAVFTEDQLQGYILVKPILNRIEADILTVGVNQYYQRKGYGHALLTAVIKEFESLYLEVRISNKPAIALYEKLGFKLVGIRPKYYQGEDAWVMKLRNT